MSPTTSMVKVGYRDEDGRVETFWATPVGKDRYRLENLPFFAYRVSFRDVVEAAPEPTLDPSGVPYLRLVVHKSGNRTLRVLFEGFALASLEGRTILAEARARGCVCEEFPPQLLSISVPAHVDLEAIATWLSEVGVWWEHVDPPYEDLYPAE